MGIYDIYGKEGAQLKVGPCVQHCYNVGDNVPLPDGVYLAWEGVVVVVEGKLAATFDHLWDKWGRIIFPHDALEADIYEGEE